MKRVERYKVMRIFGAVGVIVGILLASHAFDLHDKTALAIAVALAFSSMFVVAHSNRRLGHADLVMSDEWEPTSRVNPATGLPMLSNSIDAAGNPYGFRQHDGQRLGG